MEARTNTATTPKLRLATIRETAAAYPLTEAALRMQIFRARDNGLAPALIRLGRRVLVDLDAFERWLEEHREGRPSA